MITALPSIEIMIKSSRRPWALDRLLASLRRYLVGLSDVDVFVVDDRTDPTFLDALSAKYPEIRIWKSADPIGKENSVDSDFVQNWRMFAQESTADYLLVIEDDQWLVAELNIFELASFMRSEGLCATQLAIAGRDMPKVDLTCSRADDWDFYLPAQLQAFSNPSFRNLPSRLWTQFVTSPSWIPRRAFGALCWVLPELDRRSWVPIAMANPIAGVLFQREYWLKLWKPGQERINENLQIKRVIHEITYSQSQHHILAAGKIQYFATTFVSSISLDLGVNLDWSLMNSAWSLSWMEGKLSFPPDSGDWTAEKLAAALEAKGVDSSRYISWVEKFKEMHNKV